MFIRKFLVICFFLTGTILSAGAQENMFRLTETPGTYEKDYKVCSFDKEATAIVFAEEAVSEYNDYYNLVTHHHVKLKILSDKGIEYGNITIPFYRDDNFEEITVLEGVVYNYDNNPSVNYLEKKSVYRQNVNKYWGEVKFALPGVRAGSIIEYTYRSNMKNYGGLSEWVFQKEIPVLKSSYNLTLIPNSEFSYIVQKKEGMHIDIKPDNTQGKISFEMEDIPGLRDEAYIDSKNDYLQKVSFQLSKFENVKYSSSWQQVNKELSSNSDFYGQLKKDLPGTAEFIKTVKQDSLEFNRMKAVYNYVQGNISWNGINSKYSTDGVKQAWSKKMGNSGDINLILVNLLRSVDLDASPMLVSERYNGKVHPEATFTDQFNTIYACVTIGDKRYFMDATEKYTPCHLIPFSTLNTTAFIVNKKNGELIEIKDTSAYYKENITIEASINNDGKLSGEFFIKSFDYARSNRLKDFKTKSNSEFEKIFTGTIPGLALDSINVLNGTDETAALDIKSKFNYRLNSSGEYLFLPINFFAGLNENPFLSDNRFSNINFGYKQSLKLNFHIKIDQSYTIDVLPKSVKLTNEDKDIIFTRATFKDSESNEILVKISLDIPGTLYTAGQYDMIKDFYKKMYSFLNEQVVLKKK